MPAAVVMDCICEGRACQRKEIRGRGVHGAFLEAVRRVSPELAEELHKGSQAKPFTLSTGRWLGKSHKDVFRIRLTLLNDLHLPLLFQLQEATRSEPLQIGTNRFRIQAIRGGIDGTEEWARSSPWSSLLTQASTSSTIRLNFATTTSFRQASRERPVALEQPLPLPHLVLGSALKNWEQWSQQDLPPNLRQVIEQYIEVSGPFFLKSNTYSLAFNSQEKQVQRHVIGSVGQISYRIRTRDLDETIVRQINALADSLFYTGAGQKTTMGMGVVRRVDEIQT